MVVVVVLGGWGESGRGLEMGGGGVERLGGGGGYGRLCLRCFALEGVLVVVFVLELSFIRPCRSLSTRD